MSWWDSLSTNITKVVDSAIQSASNTYNTFVSFPDEVKCVNENCLQVTPVPSHIFAWVCVNGHEMSPIDTKCTQCSSTKKQSIDAGLYHPRVNCVGCRRLIDVAETNMSRYFYETIYTTPHAASKAAQNIIQKTSSEIQRLSSPPLRFNCRHCSVELFAPTSAWTCSSQTCRHSNPDGSYQCERCSAHRYEKGVMCGVCNRVTSVPSTQAEADLFIAANKLSQSASKGYHYVAGDFYFDCSTCTHANPITKEQADAICNNSVDQPLSRTSSNTDASLTTPLTSEPAETSDPDYELVSLHSGDTSDTSGNVEDTISLACTNCGHINHLGPQDVKSRLIKSPTTNNTSPHQAPPEQHNEHTSNTDVVTTTSGTSDGTQNTTSPDSSSPATLHKCTLCDVSDTWLLKRTIQCYGCEMYYCRTCAPYIRTVERYSPKRPFCLGCAAKFDHANEQQAQHQDDELDPHVINTLNLSASDALPVPTAPPSPTASDLEGEYPIQDPSDEYMPQASNNQEMVLQNIDLFGDSDDYLPPTYSLE